MRFSRFISITLSAFLLCGIGSHSMAQKALKRPVKTNTERPKTNPKPQPRPTTPGRTNNSNTARGNKPAAQTSGRGNISRTTLYTFAPGEVLYNYEYISGNKFGNNNWAIITMREGSNGNSNEWSFVKNGQKAVDKAQALEVIAYDPSTNDATVIFRDSNGKIWYNEKGQVVGPIESIYYYENIEAPFNLSFFYTKMGVDFFRDRDGNVVQVFGDKNLKNPKIIHHSRNGQHTMQFNDTGKIVYVDGKSYRLAPDENSDVRIFSIQIFDNGTWFVTGDSKTSSGSYPNFYKGVAGGRYLETNGKQFVHPTKGFVEWTEQNYPEEYKKAQSFSISADQFPWKWDSNKRVWNRESKFYLTGKNGRDEFISNWEYDYVMVNGQKKGTASAVDAWYDSRNNTFDWITIENNKLIKNSYQL